ncbi:hypothetical protein NDU88_005027 [Pleurodeles waltl]|uniref:Uncharacterized protein n=1 Tax=Pleurodeles waltl TaxID=8319 RepID=A0AAV7RII9_PLEWA|nr:hypothetical protein NDU88_005027 [Pleurodeles waltl]
MAGAGLAQWGPGTGLRAPPQQGCVCSLLVLVTLLLVQIPVCARWPPALPPIGAGDARFSGRDAACSVPPPLPCTMKASAGAGCNFDEHITIGLYDSASGRLFHAQWAPPVT